MPDDRTRIDKLMAMATQGDSPQEAAVAQTKLATMGLWPPPPPPPTAVGGPFPEPDPRAPLGFTWAYTTNTGNTTHAQVHFWVRVPGPFGGDE